MKSSKIDIAFGNRLPQSESPGIFERLVDRNRPRCSFAARTAEVVARVLVSSLSIRERLSHECCRRRLNARNGRILRAHRCNAGDQHTNEKSENISAHNCSKTAIPTKPTA